MSYKKELKAQYRAKTRRMAELIARGNPTTREREEAAEITRELASIDDKLSSLGNDKSDLRGVTSRRETRDKRDYKHDNRVTGRTAEVLDSQMSVRKWVDRAAQNGMSVESRDGRPQKIVGSSFDDNAYWGARLGLSKPNTELRTLNEDTSGSGLAITPQSWTARFIDYAYPLTLLGQLGASIVPMTTEIVNVPQLTGAVQPQWIAEGAQPLSTERLRFPRCNWPQRERFTISRSIRWSLLRTPI